MARFKNSSLYHTINSETISADKTLTIDDAQVQLLTPSADYNITLPDASDCSGLFFIISCLSNVNQLTIIYNLTTVTTLIDESCKIISNGSNWIIIG